ncbi:olfactory receptor 8k1-like [Lynx pardinus]|uniref:Olfactory receptor 8k1-like n=2 Tax=Lynx TaxID=13124 RepID=A0A485NDU3_LYNPA|nr:olfactory receptor 8k1-like [Lynx pardinus]
MGQQNLTSQTEFILMGVTRQPELQVPLFGVFLIIYTVTVVGNLGMIILTQVDSRLHTPMYFFIKHLAFIDLGNSTVICPKMLVNFVVDQNAISYYACATQLAFFLMFIISEFFILSAMAYDRYLAICNPLLYNVIMSQRLCHMLVGIPYLYSTFQALMFTIKIFTLTFCGSNVISHFYCDDVALLLMLCSNAQEIELLIILFSAFNLISSLLVVLVSYILILISIFQMHSAEGRKKAFSTCGSHLTVVIVFYGSLLFMYMQPKSAHSFDTDKMASVFYTLVIPMLNPLIYSLRNKEVTKMNPMEKQNHSAVIEVTEFILLGITSNPGLQAPLLAIFLIIYLITVTGNLGIVILTHLDSKLNTPMYFFLRHLSITDLGYSTVIGPKMMVNFVVHKNTISYHWCATQLAVFEIFIITELFILSAMAYDRYVAICKPLLYVVIMAEKVRWALVLLPYFYSTFVSLFLTIKLFKLSFCGSNIISYFYCDCLPLISMLCSDTHELELIILGFSGCNLLSSLLIVLISYMFILVAILRMNSTEGRYKAFSTCSSHLTVVVVFYGTLLFIYLQPKSSHTFDIDKMASVFYTLVIPMLNPLIYSLRNKEVKDALKRILTNRCKIPT